MVDMTVVYVVILFHVPSIRGISTPQNIYSVYNLFPPKFEKAFEPFDRQNINFDQI